MLQHQLLRFAVLINLVSFTIAQQGTGSIKGSVTDQLGSLVTNARVVLKDDKGATTSITTSAVGLFEFKSLRPGRYELRVTVPGFVVYEDKAVVVEAHKTTTTDVLLSVELEAQQVNVDDRSAETETS